MSTELLACAGRALRAGWSGRQAASRSPPSSKRRVCRIRQLDIQKGTQENVVKAAIANIQTHASGSRRALQAGAAAAAPVKDVSISWQ